MTGVFESSKCRINASMLSQYVNRPVCFTGRVEKVHPSGKSFTLTDGEGKHASVELNDPLEEELSGIVEVVGMVSNKGTIMAAAYSVFRDERGISFDGHDWLVSLVSGRGEDVCPPCCYMNESEQEGVQVFLLKWPDLELYNEALKVLHDFPQYYPFEVSSSG